MSHLSNFCGEKAHSRQQINDAPFEREISNGKTACGKVSRVHRVVLGESRANRTLPVVSLYESVGGLGQEARVFLDDLKTDALVQRVCPYP